MIERLANFWHSVTWESIIIGVVLFLVSFVVSLAAIGIVMVKIPPNYFSSHYERDFLPDSPWLVRWGAVIAKKYRWRFPDPFGHYFVAAGRTRPGLSDDPARPHNAGYSRQAADRGEDHQTAEGPCGC